MIFKRAAFSHPQCCGQNHFENSTSLSTFWSQVGRGVLRTWHVATMTLIMVSSLLIVASPGAAFALAARGGHRCEFLFEAPPPDRVPFLQRPHVQTVRIVGIEQGDRGEEFFRLRRLDPSAPWGSRYAIRSFDPQGDPSLIFSILGPDLAHILGFRFSGDDLIAPTAETMNRRLARFNRYLVAKGITAVPISFYSQRTAYKESFLRHWYQELRIPVEADLSTHTIHDISFHYSAVLLPPQMARMLQVQAGIAWHWLQNPLSRLLPSLSSENVRYIDQISVSANVVPGESGIAHFRFWKTVFANADDEALAARRATPLELFRERIEINNRSSGSTEVRPLVADLEEKAVPFLAELATSFPEWNRPVESFGLIDYASVRTLYFERSADLRYAARKFREEVTP